MKACIVATHGHRLVLSVLTDEEFGSNCDAGIEFSGHGSATLQTVLSRRLISNGVEGMLVLDEAHVHDRVLSQPQG